jgi:hypothetical protein
MERFAKRALHSMSASLDAKKNNIVRPVYALKNFALIEQNKLTGTSDALYLCPLTFLLPFQLNQSFPL